MSHLRRKSEINFKVAESLANNPELHAASVHCGYYACFQLIKHTLQYEIVPHTTLPRTGDAHLVAKEKMFEALKIIDDDIAFDFNDNFVNLQDFRNEADYDNSEVTLPRAEKALELSGKICEVVTAKFL